MVAFSGPGHRWHLGRPVIPCGVLSSILASAAGSPQQPHARSAASTGSRYGHMSPGGGGLVENRWSSHAEALEGVPLLLWGPCRSSGVSGWSTLTRWEQHPPCHP